MTNETEKRTYRFMYGIGALVFAFGCGEIWGGPGLVIASGLFIMGIPFLATLQSLYVE